MTAEHVKLVEELSQRLLRSDAEWVTTFILARERARVDMFYLHFAEDLKDQNELIALIEYAIPVISSKAVSSLKGREDWIKRAKEAVK